MTTYQLPTNWNGIDGKEAYEKIVNGKREKRLDTENELQLEKEIKAPNLIKKNISSFSFDWGKFISQKKLSKCKKSFYAVDLENVGCKEFIRIVRKIQRGRWRGLIYEEELEKILLDYNVCNKNNLDCGLSTVLYTGTFISTPLFFIGYIFEQRYLNGKNRPAYKLKKESIDLELSNLLDRSNYY